MSIAKTTRPHLLTREAAAARIEALEAALREIVAIHEANIGRDAELSLRSWEVARAALAPEPNK